VDGPRQLRAGRLLDHHRAAGHAAGEPHDGRRQPWYNLDPNHALPANVRLGGLGQSATKPNGVWKCNLFGGNALYVGGSEPPYYGNRGKGEYPNANQFYAFSDKYAAQFGNKVHFKMVDEVALNGLDGDAKKARLLEVLRSAQPSDLLMVDHQGADVSDGGHTRVVMSNDLQADGTGSIHSAQATQSEGRSWRRALVVQRRRARVDSEAQPPARGAADRSSRRRHADHAAAEHQHQHHHQHQHQHQRRVHGEARGHLHEDCEDRAR